MKRVISICLLFMNLQNGSSSSDIVHTLFVASLLLKSQEGGAILKVKYWCIWINSEHFSVKQPLQNEAELSLVPLGWSYWGSRPKQNGNQGAANSCYSSEKNKVEQGLCEQRDSPNEGFLFWNWRTEDEILGLYQHLTLASRARLFAITCEYHQLLRDASLIGCCGHIWYYCESLTSYFRVKRWWKNVFSDISC